MNNLFLLIFLIIFTVTDIKVFKIFNIIAYPAIFLTLVYTGFWAETFIAFIAVSIITEDVPNKKMDEQYNDLVKKYSWIGWLDNTFIAKLLCKLNKKVAFMKIGGGDIKLFMLISAFKGWIFIPLFILTFGLIKLYRVAHNYRLGLPVSPFALVSFLLFQFTITIFAKMAWMAV